MRLSSGLADSRSTVHVVSDKDSEVRHRTDLDELVDVEYSPFTRLDNDLDILLAYKQLDSFWCQRTSSLPNPSRVLSTDPDDRPRLMMSASVRQQSLRARQHCSPIRQDHDRNIISFVVLVVVVVTDQEREQQSRLNPGNLVRIVSLNLIRPTTSHSRKDGYAWKQKKIQTNAEQTRA